MSRKPIKLTVDALVIRYQQHSGLQVLLVKRKHAPFKNLWALPGGFVEYHESLLQAVQRELLEETAVRVHYWEQLYAFGRPDRDPRGRVVSIAYLALAHPQISQASAASDAAEVKWFKIQELPEMAFDHQEILNRGLERLYGGILHKAWAFELLDSEFSISDLETLCRMLQISEPDCKRFISKMLRLGAMEEITEKVSKKPGAASGRLKFNRKKYHQIAKEGFEI